MRRAAARAAKEVSLPSDPLLMNHDSIMHGQPPKLGVQIQITVSGTDWRWFRTLDACGKTVLVNIIAIGGIDHIPAQKVIRRQVKWVDFASFAVPFDGWWVAVTERPAIEPAIQPANPERSGADVSYESVCLPRRSTACVRSHRPAAGLGMGRGEKNLLGCDWLADGGSYRWAVIGCPLPFAKGPMGGLLRARGQG